MTAVERQRWIASLGPADHVATARLKRAASAVWWARELEADAERWFSLGASRATFDRINGEGLTLHEQINAEWLGAIVSLLRAVGPLS